jgi:predicted DNA-binding transcriptional regulator AlpA
MSQPELWGIAEVCDHMGVTKPTVYAWMNDPTFPEPEHRFRMGPAFRASKVRAWRTRIVKQRRERRAF